MEVSHVDAIMRVYDPANTAIPGSPNPYYINPIGIQSITLSVVEVGKASCKHVLG